MRFYYLKNKNVISNNNEYGKARDILPPQLSLPLLTLSKKNDVFPWLDYAYGYGLNNAVLKNGCNPKDYNSYKTIRTFNGCDSEEGFINVHVAMVAQSGDLLKFQQECLESIHNNDREKFNSSLNNHYEILHSIVNTLQTMWKASNYKDYLSFRTLWGKLVIINVILKKRSVLTKGIHMKSILIEEKQVLKTL